MPQGGARFTSLALVYYLSGFQPFEFGCCDIELTLSFKHPHLRRRTNCHIFRADGKEVHVESISGASLYDETIHQQKQGGTTFVTAFLDAGIVPGIKVDVAARFLLGIL